MDFRIVALPAASFAPLFGLSDQKLAGRGAVRCVADRRPGFPCRVSLRDADPGESLLMSVRAFDVVGMMVDADVTDGADAAPLVRRLLDNPRVDFLHLHNARPGCHAARAVHAAIA